MKMTAAVTSGGAFSAAGEEALLSLLESLRINMRTPPVGYIPLDPLILEDQTHELRHPAIEATINLDTMALTGLSEFTAEDVSLNIGDLTAHLKLSCVDLRLAGQHHVKAKIVKVIPISRQGGFTVITESPQVRVRVGLRVVKGRLEVRTITTQLEISGVKTKVTNLPASNLIGRLIDSMLADLLRNELPRLEKELDTVLKSLLNTEFSNYNVGMSLQLLRTSDKIMGRGNVT